MNREQFTLYGNPQFQKTMNQIDLNQTLLATVNKRNNMLGYERGQYLK